MELPKIHLSSAETELMRNAEVILTKNRVLQKIKGLLEIVQQQQLSFVEKNRLTGLEAFVISPKISKGENYLGLPFQILDYPRLSAPGDLFFIRTMFWWGNFFSSTLHLSGSYKDAHKKNVLSSFPVLGEYFIGANADPWLHHFEDSNYRKINGMTRQAFELQCESGAHLKLAARIPLSEWERAPIKLYEHWKVWLRVCGLIP
jgi:hypothetical protein